MSIALELYEQLTEAGEDKVRAKLIAEAFDRLEERYPQLKDVTTQGQLRETELRLLKEIESVRLEVESVRLEIKEVESRLRKEIASVQVEIKEVEIRLVNALHRHTLWVIGSIGLIIGFIRFLDWLLRKLPMAG